MKVALIGNLTTTRELIIKKLADEGVGLCGACLETKSLKPNFSTVSNFYEAEKRILKSQLEGFDINKKPSTAPRYVENINDSNALEYIQQLDAEVVIISGARKLKASLVNHLNKHYKLVFNVHLGIAEEYKGLDSNVWASYHKDFKNLGVTLHKINNELDTGDIYFQEKLTIPTGTKIEELRKLEINLATKLISKLLKLSKDDPPPPTKQIRKGRYYSFMPSCLKDIATKNFNQHFSTT